MTAQHLTFPDEGHIILRNIRSALGLFSCIITYRYISFNYYHENEAFMITDLAVARSWDGKTDLCDMKSRDTAGRIHKMCCSCTRCNGVTQRDWNYQHNLRLWRICTTSVLYSRCYSEIFYLKAKRLLETLVLSVFTREIFVRFIRSLVSNTHIILNPKYMLVYL